MKKASRILLTIGGVFHIVNSVSFFIAALVFLIASIVFFATGANWFGFVYDSVESEEVMQIAMTISGAMYIVCALMFVGFGIMSIIAARLTFNAIENGDKSKYITVIVLSAILDVIVAIVGSIFGLITLNRENSEKEPEVVE